MGPIKKDPLLILRLPAAGEFIDSDQNENTGREGYYLVINNKVIDRKTTTLTRINDDGTLGKSINIFFQVSENKLMIKVKRCDLSENNKMLFDFHWADNIGEIDIITSFSLYGHSAPERLTNYQFQLSLDYGINVI